MELEILGGEINQTILIVFPGTKNKVGVSDQKSWFLTAGHSMTKQCSLPKNLKTTSFSLKVQISTIFLGAPPPKNQVQQFPIYNPILSILNPPTENGGICFELDTGPSRKHQSLAFGSWEPQVGGERRSHGSHQNGWVAVTSCRPVWRLNRF